MPLLRKYQLEIIALFLLSMFVIWGLFYVFRLVSIDPHRYEWVVALPLIIVYIWFLTRVRLKIKRGEHRQLTGTTLVYWILLGIILFFSYSTPLPASDYWSIEALFVIFTLFLADSYWDFRKLRFKNGKT